MNTRESTCAGREPLERAVGESRWRERERERDRERDRERELLGRAARDRAARERAVRESR
jgi:hypothetical protein